ncbi:unnamed protein product, partial [marine sediment metagenome]
DSQEWKAARMWMRRHNVRYRWCYQGNDGIRFLLVENHHPGIPGLQQVKVQDIDWNAIMDEMPEGSSFRGSLRTLQLPKEDMSGYPLIWQRQVQVKAPPGVLSKAQAFALERSVGLDPRGKTAEELEAMIAERMGIFEEEFLRLGGEIAVSRMVRIRVNLDLIDWISYGSRLTLASKYGVELVPSGYAVGA